MELIMLRPLFKGDEVKMENKKIVPFQRDQVQKIFEILGKPTSKAQRFRFQDTDGILRGSLGRY